MLLIAEILLSVLAVFGLYLLGRRALATEEEIVLAVICDASNEKRKALINHARDDAWLCGNRRVIVLDAKARDVKFKEI